MKELLQGIGFFSAIILIALLLNTMRDLANEKAIQEAARATAVIARIESRIDRLEAVDFPCAVPTPQERKE